ncbi:purine-cytosine transporter [Nesterenkonia sp. AN1]|nr:cytosine permease [Nesterenkonia aurantiaca]EXF23928.1 purine-cytosine transporter [Nesterenkonia sp. AN1]
MNSSPKNATLTADAEEEQVPLRGTLGGGRIMLIWLAANLVVTTLLTGTLFVPGISFGDSLLWIVCGTVLGAGVLTLVAVMGVRTGLSTMALTKGSFGLRGSIVPSLSNLVILMGWSWVQAMLAGISVDYLIHSWTGYSNPILFAALCQAFVVFLAIFGHVGISRIEPLFGLVIVSIIAYVFAVAFSTHPPAEYFAIAIDPALGMDGALVFDIVFATAISWTVLSADLTRTARSVRAGATGAAIGYTTSTILAMTLGATAISYVLLEGDEAIAFDPTVIIMAFGAPLAAVMFLSVMATNTMVMYGMTLSLQHAFPRRRPLPFLPTALGLGVVAVIGSTWLGLLDQFTNFLATIGALFIPVFAVMIVDYYLARRRSYHREILNHKGGKYWFTGGWNIGAILVWATGAGLYTLLTTVWFSPVGAALPTVLFSGLFYWLWTRIAGISEPQGVESQHLADQLELTTTK